MGRSDTAARLADSPAARSHRAGSRCAKPLRPASPAPRAARRCEAPQRPRHSSRPDRCSGGRRDASRWCYRHSSRCPACRARRRPSAWRAHRHADRRRASGMRTTAAVPPPPPRMRCRSAGPTASATVRDASTKDSAWPPARQSGRGWGIGPVLTTAALGSVHHNRPARADRVIPRSVGPQSSWPSAAAGDRGILCA